MDGEEGYEELCRSGLMMRRSMYVGKFMRVTHPLDHSSVHHLTHTHALPTKQCKHFEAAT